MTPSPDAAAQALHDHLRTGLTTVARAWAVTRRDGLRLAFTDHDRDLRFDGQVFRADSGLSASALQQATGLSVDNTEALGVLTADGITEADIEAGRFDGAEVTIWMVNWADVAQRKLLFRGHLGEITRAGAAFRAEVRGLTAALNRPLGRVYQTPCAAVLGDARCRFDLTTPGYSWEGAVQAVPAPGQVLVPVLAEFSAGWFERGALTVLDGAAQGLSAPIKRDVIGADGRLLTLWTDLRATLAPGDHLRITAGCDKRMETCRIKFNNLLNHQGFPDIPQEDWVAINPGATASKTGGSLR